MSVFGEHRSDKEGNPAGGNTYGIGINIRWQDGQLGRDENRIAPNGAFVENVIGAALDRLEYYQKSKFACEANEKAIEHLREAIYCLQQRTADREERKVEGTHEQ